MLCRFHLIPERHGQTDGRTEGQTVRIAISIPRVSVLTRVKTRICIFDVTTFRTTYLNSWLRYNY